MAVILDKLVRRFKSASLNKQTLAEIGFLPFVVDRQAVGWVHKSTLDILGNWPAIFLCEAERVVLSPAIQSPEQRTQFFQRIVTQLAQHDCIPPLQNRLMTVGGDEPLFTIDCAAALFFGLEIPVAYLAATCASNVGPMMWLKCHNVAGAVHYDMAIQEVVTIEKNLATIFNDECMQIGITTGLAQPTGLVRTCRVIAEGLVRCRMYTYEIEVDDAVRLQDSQGTDQYARLTLRQARELLVNGDRIGLEGSLVLAELLKRYGWVKQLPNGLWMST